VFAAEATPPRVRHLEALLKSKMVGIPYTPAEEEVAWIFSIVSRTTVLRCSSVSISAMSEQMLAVPLTEPPRVCRRLFRLSHAAMAGCSVTA
jgi:hypothetical protein